MNEKEQQLADKLLDEALAAGSSAPGTQRYNALINYQLLLTAVRTRNESESLEMEMNESFYEAPETCLFCGEVH